MSNVANSTATIYINGVAADNTLKELRLATVKLKNELANLSPTSQEFVDKSKRLKEVQGRLDEINGELKNTKTIFGQVQSTMGKFGLLAVGYLGFDALTGKIGNVINKNAELSDSWADVMKTTGMTKTQVEGLSKSLDTMDTRSSRAELLALARDAGKLGITGTRDVEAFVRAADKIKIALGEDLGEDALTQIGKLVNVFQLKEQFGLEDAMIKVASSINTLGASSEASEGYLVNFLNRMGGIAPMANISIDQVLAMGATLDSLGQTAEVSSTALSSLFMKMAKDSEKYAKIAGVSTEEFKKKMNENALEAFIMVLEASGKTEGGIIELTNTLGDLGVEGGRATGVFGALAKNTDLLRSQMDIAKGSFDEGNSVLDEFNTKNSNLAANLEKVQKWMSNLVTGSKINAFFGDLVGWMVRLINVPLSEKLEEERIEMRKVELQLLNTNMPTADRVKLIKQLQEQYPGFLANVDAEKVTNEQLTGAMKQLNEELINKIILQKEDEQIQRNNDAIANKRLNFFKREDALRNQIIETAEKNGVSLKKGLNDVQQAMYVLNKVASSGSPIVDYFKQRQQLVIAYNDYASSLAGLNQQEERGLALLNAREELVKRLGINQQDREVIDNIVTTTEPTTTVAGVATADEQKNAYDEAQKKLEAYFNVERALVKGRQVEDLANKELYEQELMDVETRKLEGLRELHTRYGMDVTAIDVQIADHRIKLAEHAFKLEDDARKLALENIQTAIDEEEAAINQAYAQGLISEEEHRLQLQELKTGGLVMMKLAYEAYGMDVSAIDKKITASQAEEQKLRMKNAAEEAKFRLELNKAEANAQNELMMLQASNRTQLLGMLRGFAHEHTLLYKAMFVAQKAAAIAEVVIRAQVEKANISAWLATAGPPGMILAGIQRQIVNARMATSIALIAGQAIQEARGFFEGGYTGNGSGMPDKTGARIAGVVHENEYVTPAWMVREPKYANVVGWLENERTGKSSNNTSMPTEITANVDQSEMVSLMQKMLVALEQKSSSETRTLVIGDDELWKMQERTQKLNKYQDNASLRQ